jgi:SRSO17 transposase
MTKPQQVIRHQARPALPTISLIDQPQATYQDLFPEVRSFESFKFLHLGIISDIKRKSLPAMPSASIEAGITKSFYRIYWVSFEF